jgi:hypothetical protein
MMGLPDGVIFALNPDHSLEQKHNFVFALGILPECTVVRTDTEILCKDFPKEAGLGDLRNISPGFVGVSGGPQAVKDAICKMVDVLWEATTDKFGE